MTAADKRQQDAEQRRRVEQQREEDTRWMLNDPRGRRLMRAWLGDAGVTRQSFVTGDQHATAFNEGRRSVGLAMMAQVLKHAPEAYVRMLMEGDGSPNFGPAPDTAAP